MKNSFPQIPFVDNCFHIYKFLPFCDAMASEYKVSEAELEYLEDYKLCRKAIEDLDDDGNGQISIFDLETVLERMDLQYDEFQLCKLTSELDCENKGYIEFESILQVYQNFKKALRKSDDDQDTLDAYTAIGGPADKSGHVNDKVLIRVINEEFELPINMPELIKSVDESCNGEIQYEQFCRMLKDKPQGKIK